MTYEKRELIRLFIVVTQRYFCFCPKLSFKSFPNIVRHVTRFDVYALLRIRRVWWVTFYGSVINICKTELRNVRGQKHFRGESFFQPKETQSGFWNTWNPNQFMHQNQILNGLGRPYVAGGWCRKTLGLDGVGKSSDTIHRLRMVSEDLPRPSKILMHKLTHDTEQIQIQAA